MQIGGTAEQHFEASVVMHSETRKAFIDVTLQSVSLFSLFGDEQNF
jgi:hypothetical protein